MNGYPLQTFWAGPMSDMEILCLKSWVGHGHPVHLYTYDDLSGLPAGVEVMDAALILPEDEFELFDGKTPKTVSEDAFSVMPFSDRFRFTLLRINGGLWMDLDIILVRPIPAELFEADFFCSSEHTLQRGAFKSKNPSKANIGVVYCAEPESDLMVKLTEAKRPTRSAWDGLKNFQKWVDRLGLSKGVLQPSVFCVLPWWSVKDIFSTVSHTDILPSKYGVPGTSVKPPAEAVGVHLWRGLLRAQGLPYKKASAFSHLSYLGRLYQQAEQVYQQKVAALSES